MDKFTKLWGEIYIQYPTSSEEIWASICPQVISVQAKGRILCLLFTQYFLSRCAFVFVCWWNKLKAKDVDCFVLPGNAFFTSKKISSSVQDPKHPVICVCFQPVILNKMCFSHWNYREWIKTNKINTHNKNPENCSNYECTKNQLAKNKWLLNM